MGYNTAHNNIHLVYNIVRKIVDLYGMAPNYGIHWLPGHLAIEGNEDADVLAKQGAADAGEKTTNNIRVIDRVYHLHEQEDSFLRHYTDHTPL
jgi:ribonuclease HI